ncbi:MAG: endonuclease/exonuclease/phosphatase family protein [Treponema sp.]
MKKIFSALITAIFLLSGCARKNASGAVRIICWNVQTFFDGQDDGTEYRTFRRASGWSEDLYRARLEKLCSFIKANKADLYVFEEIENEKIVYDISNFLAELSWRLSGGLEYAAFAKEDGGAIGCAVLSRLPLSGLKLHSLDIRTADGAQPPLRPIMELTVNAGGLPLTLLVNHWKSKAGGAEKTETWRDAQERLLARLTAERAQKEGSSILICGDFNRNLSEFKCAEESGTVFLRGDGAEVPVACAWLTYGAGYKTGSYYFKGGWEKIDHFFAAGNAVIRDFEPLTHGDWTDADGVPRAYRAYAQSGWSDHLPIRCTIIMGGRLGRRRMEFER